MKYLITFLLLLSFNAFAVTPLAKMELLPNGISITVTDFAEAEGFENYKCNVDFESWAYTLSAKKITVNGETMYRCLDQGALSANRYYNVWFTFEDRPFARKSESPLFRLIAE